MNLRIFALALSLGVAALFAPELAFAQGTLPKIELKRTPQSSGWTGQQSDPETGAVIGYIVEDNVNPSCDNPNANAIFIVAIPSNLDISDDNVAKGLLNRTGEYIKTRCAMKGFRQNVIYVVNSDLTDVGQGRSNRNLLGSKAVVYASFNTCTPVCSPVCACGLGDYHNKASDIIRRQQQAGQQQEAIAKAQHDTELDRQARTLFIERFGVKAFVKCDQVGANPFRFKGNVVGIRARFKRMSSESVASFFGDCARGGELVVSAVPAVRFSGGENVVLAVRVNGIRTVLGTDGFEHSITDFEYIGDYECKSFNCGEIAD
jgi:hypothetical protein